MRAILTYHSIDDSGSPISVAPAVFRQHVRWLASGAVRVLPLEEIATASGGDAVALTFDDGFVNFDRHAAPLLRDAALPATLFVVTGCVGGNNAWGGARDPRIPHLPLLGWDALGRLAASGVSLGAHTRRHCALTAASPAALLEEVEGGAADITEHTGRRPRAFAYPYGAVNGAAAASVRASFAWGCTTELSPLRSTDDPALLPRFDAYYFRRAGQLEAWGSTLFRHRLRCHALARGARARVLALRRPAGVP